MAPDEHSIRKHSPGFVIAAGTQVVLKVSKALPSDVQNDERRYKKPGSVGIVAQSPARADGQYLVEFADGETIKAHFEELTLRRKEVDNELSKIREDLQRYVIYRCQVGSRAYGLANDESDDDVRGIYLPPARLHWSLYALPEQLEKRDDSHDEVFWELEKFLRLALKANPNVLETLWTPMVLESSDTAEELRNIRSAFLSKHVYKTYSGYVLSQFRRMKNAFDRSGQYKVKHAMHLIRLLHSGIYALERGDILIDVCEYRDELLRIRAGKLSFEKVRRRALELDRAFQAAFEATTLPEQPDYVVVNEFLIRARRSVVEK